MSKLVRTDVVTICDLLRRESNAQHAKAHDMRNLGGEAAELQADESDEKGHRLRYLADRIRDARHVDVVTARRPR
jgi:hypothetical protein